MFNRIDIHAHLNFADFDIDRDVVVKRTLESGTAVINVGSQYDTSKSAVELAEKYKDGVYAMVGLHPIHTSSSFHDKKELGGGVGETVPVKGFVSRGEIFDVEKYRELLSHPKVVGIGECGLDYYHMSPESAAKQKEVFQSHIILANETKKPLMLHIRDAVHNDQAYDDALDILEDIAKVKGDIHFFAGNTKTAKRFLDLGFTLSFTGVITFASEYGELIDFVPLDMIQAETDSPFVAPVPFRGKRNEPIYVAEIIKKIADVKKLPLEKVEKVLMENAKRVWEVCV